MRGTAPNPTPPPCRAHHWSAAASAADEVASVPASLSNGPSRAAGGDRWGFHAFHRPFFPPAIVEDILLQAATGGKAR